MSKENVGRGRDQEWWKDGVKRLVRGRVGLRACAVRAVTTSTHHLSSISQHRHNLASDPDAASAMPRSCACGKLGAIISYSPSALRSRCADGQCSVVLQPLPVGRGRQQAK